MLQSVLGKLRTEDVALISGHIMTILNMVLHRCVNSRDRGAGAAVNEALIAVSALINGFSKPFYILSVCRF
jgi:hypothetical protein